MLSKVMAMKFMQRDKLEPVDQGKVKLVDPLMWALPNAHALLAAARPPVQRVGYTEIHQLVAARLATPEVETKPEEEPLKLEDLIGKRKRKGDESSKKKKKQKHST